MMSDMEEEEMEVDHPDKENVKKLTRGEKSKVAAKGRRDKEHIAMLDLMKELPVSMEVLQKMDKASVVKIAICYLKIKHFVQKDIAIYGHKAVTNGSTPQENDVTTLQTKNYSAIGNVREGKLILEALNGFLIFVNRKGSMKFVSKTIEDHLGLKQEHLLGRNVFDYIHESDQQELHKQFTEDKKVDKANMYSCDDEPQRVFYVRMKFNLPKPGSKTRHNGFMLVQWSGKMKRHISMKQGTVVTDGLLCICRAMQTTPLLEIRMDGNMFMSRHDLGMTFTFCDTRILTLIGYEPSEVIGKTAYHFHNPIDAPKVGDCHHNLIIKGTSVSKYYRFLGKTDNWVWLQTRATIIYNTANKAQYIVCMNYVISEEEGERYLMLEEHQQANQHTENTVLTLPDNQHTLFHATCHLTSGPKIVELEEENLEKTACFNGELDKPQAEKASVSPRQQQATNHLSSNSVLNMTGFQQNNTAPAQASLPPLQTGVPISSDQSVMVNQEISQPNVASMPGLANAPSAGAVENSNNMTVMDPQVPDYVQACSPEGSTGTYASSLCFPHANDQYNSGMGDQNMAPSCSSSHSEDAGYESASSPYNGSYFSPQMVSPGCSYNDSGNDRGYTPDVNNPRNLIQGQNCSFGIGYGSMPQNSGNHSNMLQGEGSMDVLDTAAEFSNPVLDEILQSLNQPTSDSLEENMALVYSTIESLTSNSPAAVSTSIKSPMANTYEYVKSSDKLTVAESTVQFEANKPAVRTDKPLLRSFLTMPQEALPSQPPGGFLQMLNKNGEKSSAFNKEGKTVPCVIERQVNTSAQVQSHSNQTCRENNIPKPCGSASENTPLETDDNSESLDFDDIPEYALQYLVNDISDAQAQALIADLQGDGDLQSDSFMDTSESDFTKQFVSSLESLNASTGSENTSYKTQNGPPVGNNIPFSQCRTQCFPLGTGMKCNATQGHNPNFGSKGNTASSNNYQSGNSSGHDHVYHQSMNRLNGQSRPRCHKPTENRSMFIYNKVSCGQNTCHSQTQTSEHCMSELERHLRNKLTSKATGFFGAHDQCINSEKPFLQQLLTGELTNDMYMKMERKRFEDKTVMPN